MQVNAFIALIAGLASFFSPCVLPLIPAWLAFIGGTASISVARYDGKLNNDDERQGSGAEVQSVAGTPVKQTVKSGGKFRLVMLTVFFVLGFSIVFSLLGVLASAGGSIASEYTTVFELVAGGVLLVLGMNMVFSFIPSLYRERRLHLSRSPAGPVGALLIGMAFGAGWTPCVGPILASILVLAGMENNGAGIVYLLLYSLGLGLPFVLAAVGMEHFQRLHRVVHRYLGRVQTVSGILLALMGVLIASGQFQRLTAILVSAVPQL